jgi:hypothetical protein
MAMAFRLHPTARHWRQLEVPMREYDIRQGFATFLSDGTVPFGAVREISSDGRAEVVIYVENAGEFTVPLSAVETVHFGKVILNSEALDQRLLDAIGHAHDAENIESK